MLHKLKLDSQKNGLFEYVVSEADIVLDVQGPQAFKAEVLGTGR